MGPKVVRVNRENQAPQDVTGNVASKDLLVKEEKLDGKVVLETRARLEKEDLLENKEKEERKEKRVT